MKINYQAHARAILILGRIGGIGHAPRLFTFREYLDALAAEGCAAGDRPFHAEMWEHCCREGHIQPDGDEAFCINAASFANIHDMTAKIFSLSTHP